MCRPVRTKLLSDSGQHQLGRTHRLVGGSIEPLTGILIEKYTFYGVLCGVSIRTRELIEQPLFQYMYRASLIVFIKLTIAELDITSASLYTIPSPSIHLPVCLTTGPKPLPKRALHTVRSRASSFK